ncbi:MAG: hypothetical protein ACRD2F_09555 [Terriglobales bacterium]
MFGIGQRKVVLRPAAIVPGASAAAEIGRDKNGNTTVRLQVRHLAPPENLTPAAAVYVVWVQTATAPAENKGVVKVRGDLTGDTRFLTAARDFEIFLTAEIAPSPASPSARQVLSGRLHAKQAA